MPVTIKSPNPDDVWELWKQKNVKKQDLEKHYAIKGAVFKIDDIAAAEFVKGITKAAIVYYEKTKSVKKAAAVKGKPEKVDIKTVEKEKFYEFKSNPVKAEWRGEKEVAMLNSLTPQTCSKCQGKGGMNCKKCNGAKLQPCPECGGKPSQCKACSGSGKLQIEIQVLNEKNEKQKKAQAVKCDKCYGTGKLNCSECGGSGKIPCKSCDARGLEPCPDCRGFGTLFTYSVIPVPFKEEHSSETILLPSIKLTDVEKEMGKEISQALEQVEGIMIQNPEKDLNKKFVEPNLGYMDKNIEKAVKEAEDEWKQAQKRDDTDITLPIYVFPLIMLNCSTRKGKQFEVYSIGSQQKFIVFGRI